MSYLVNACHLNFTVQIVNINRRLVPEIKYARIVTLVEETHSQRFVTERIGVSQNFSHILNRYVNTTFV